MKSEEYQNIHLTALRANHAYISLKTNTKVDMQSKQFCARSNQPLSQKKSKNKKYLIYKE